MGVPRCRCQHAIGDRRTRVGRDEFLMVVEYYFSKSKIPRGMSWPLKRSGVGQEFHAEWNGGVTTIEAS